MCTQRHAALNASTRYGSSRKPAVKVHVHALRGKLCRKLQQRRGADAAAHQRDGAAQRAVHGKPTARGARQRNGVPGPQRGQLLRARTTDLI